MKNIRETVRQLVAKYGCCDPTQLCEKMGITVLTHDLPASINGFTVRMEGMPFIVLSSALESFERRITIAHELGHIVLHSGTNSVSLSMNTSFCVTKYEREADCFAAHLLLEDGRSEYEDMEAVTADDISMITRMPKDMVQTAFFPD